jgi:hypothetical protein
MNRLFDRHTFDKRRDNHSLDTCPELSGNMSNVIPFGKQTVDLQQEARG